MALISLMIFAGAFAAVLHVAWFTLAPALPRMAALLAGEVDPVTMPGPQITVRNRRSRARAATAQLRVALREAA